eukprot:2647373-Pleurochrysis_carterae.AAC.1
MYRREKLSPRTCLRGRTFRSAEGQRRMPTCTSPLAIRTASASSAPSGRDRACDVRAAIAEDFRATAEDSDGASGDFATFAANFRTFSAGLGAFSGGFGAFSG